MCGRVGGFDTKNEVEVSIRQFRQLLLYGSQVNEALGIPVHSYDKFAHCAIPIAKKNGGNAGIFFSEPLDALFDIAHIVAHEHSRHAQRNGMRYLVVFQMYRCDSCQMS
ncbi:hypothetical protein WT97_05570 [Burkholderia sp. MSMB1459WGS]|nr:hypothetical protein WT97_05570 [Burkholderia sp. MSMB1459WGS]